MNTTGVAGQKKEPPASDSQIKGGQVITQQIKDKAMQDGWSRGQDGTLTMSGLKAFQLFGALIHGEIPAYAANLKIQPAMTFPDFLEVNSIQITGEAS